MPRIKWFNDIAVSIKTVLTRPRYVLLFLLVLIVLIAVNTLLPQRELVKIIFSSSVFGWPDRFRIIGSLLITFGVNETWLSRALFITIAVKAGINIALLVYYLQMRFKMQAAAGVSMLGILLGLAGVGCASCGSVIFSSLIGTSIIPFTNHFPLRGVEFSLISLVLICWSTYLVSKKIQNPQACKISLRK